MKIYDYNFVYERPSLAYDRLEDFFHRCFHNDNVFIDEYENLIAGGIKFYKADEPLYHIYDEPEVIVLQTDNGTYAYSISIRQIEEGY